MGRTAVVKRSHQRRRRPVRQTMPAFRRTEGEALKNAAWRELLPCRDSFARNGKGQRAERRNDTSQVSRVRSRTIEGAFAQEYSFDRFFCVLAGTVLVYGLLNPFYAIFRRYSPLRTDVWKSLFVSECAIIVSECDFLYS